MKQRQDLMRYHQELGEMLSTVDAFAHVQNCSAEVAERLQKASGLIASAARAINSALRLTLPDEAETAR